MKKAEIKKLVLSKETIASLDTDKLSEVVGGGSTTSGGFSQCQTWCNGCPPHW